MVSLLCSMFRAASVASTLSMIAVWAKVDEAQATNRIIAMEKVRAGFMGPIEPRTQGVEQITRPKLEVANCNLKSDLEVANCNLKPQRWYFSGPQPLIRNAL
jgi:hypothetical protein